MAFARNLLTPLKIYYSTITASVATQSLLQVLGRGGCNNNPRGVRKYLCPTAQNTTSTTPYFNPDAMVHVLLTLNEPLLQRSRPRGPLGLSLTTIGGGE